MLRCDITRKYRISGVEQIVIGPAVQEDPVVERVITVKTKHDERFVFVLHADELKQLECLDEMDTWLTPKVYKVGP